MSIRLKGLLMNHQQSRLENHLMDDTIVLKNVPCEMTFESSQVFMEHESEKHNYLPVFHLRGNITEIHGDFPYHISSLYFDEVDRPYLSKDCLYYPSPDELSYMIKTGKFFSNRFQIPEILDKNTYSFPAVVNLTIVPPPNPAAYEQATCMGGFDAVTDLEKLNLPLVYVGLAGSGINRKNDKLLDYYDIDVEENYESYVLTAESSGYTDPPLMMYFEEPVIEQEVQKEDMSEYYITPEEEAQMLRVSKEQQAQNVAEATFTEKYSTHTAEDVLIAKADKEIRQRIDERKQRDMHKDALDLDKTLDVENELKSEKIVERVDEQEQNKDITNESIVTNDFINDSEFISSDEFVNDSHYGPTLTEDDFVHEDEVQESVDTKSMDDIDVINEKENVSPDVPQQQVDVKMDLDPEHNAFVENERKEETESNGDLVNEDSDDFDLQDLQGSDVDDYSLQVKIDEQHSRDLAKDVAERHQQDIAETEHNDKSSDKLDSHIESRRTSDKSQINHREVTSDMQDITDAYDAMVDTHDDSEYTS